MFDGFEVSTRSVEGEALPGGHCLAEELPGAVVAHTLAFLEQEAR